jgi:acylphosphatase
VSGWVRNRTDGSVEVLAEGDADRIGQLVAWCHQGPPAAQVTHVQEKREAYQGEFDGFDIVF